MLVISSYVKPDVPDNTDQANHFSLLLLIEKLFGLKDLGYAKSATAFTAGTSGLFDNYTG